MSGRGGTARGPREDQLRHHGAAASPAAFWPIETTNHEDSEQGAAAKHHKAARDRMRVWRRVEAVPGEKLKPASHQPPGQVEKQQHLVERHHHPEDGRVVAGRQDEQHGQSMRRDDPSAGTLDKLVLGLHASSPLWPTDPWESKNGDRIVAANGHG